MNRPLLAWLPLALLTACAEAPVDKNMAQAASGDTVCQLETSTGTNVSKKRCRTEAQRAADKEQVKEFEGNRRSSPGDSMGR